MRKINFCNLPFEPDKNQVIYIENNYDKTINRFITDNYVFIQEQFKQKGLEFIYLPLLFEDQQMLKAIQYNAPYINADAITRIQLPSTYMLQYVSRQKEANEISPSLLFCPEKNDVGWTFHLTDILSSQGWFNRFLYEKFPCRKQHYIKDLVRIISTRKEDVYRRLALIEKWEAEKKKHQRYDEQDEESSIRFSIVGDNPLLYPQDDEIKEILDNLDKLRRDLQLKGITLSAIHDYIDKKAALSPLLITDDLRLFLPEYNNVEIKMNPQAKAFYFLFLNHSEGIELKRLSEHRSELLNYYRQVNGYTLDQKQIDSINKLLDYGNNNVNIIITRIKQAFFRCFDEHLACKYIVSKEDGYAYKIPLDRELIRWE